MRLGVGGEAFFSSPRGGREGAFINVPLPYSFLAILDFAYLLGLQVLRQGSCMPCHREWIGRELKECPCRLTRKCSEQVESVPEAEH